MEAIKEELIVIKTWLVDVAKKVKYNAVRYERQLKSCPLKEKKNLSGIFLNSSNQEIFLLSNFSKFGLIIEKVLFGLFFRYSAASTRSSLLTLKILFL